jgi:2-dehydro-3-deoxygalactonokinase
MNASPHPALIGLDWGTSSLRAYLLGPNGELIHRRAEGWGIQHLPEGGYVAALRGVAGEWLDRWPGLPVLAAGMVGSRNGWREVPYIECPADPASIAKGLVTLDSGCGTIHLVPGLMQGGPLPDVMRGEEMQIVGALAMQPKLAERSLLVLPGTHCKWAVVERGRVVRFTTYLTGELFAMLRDHSIIGRPAKETGAPAAGSEFDRDAFTRGVRSAHESGAVGIAPLLFTARSLFLTGVLAAQQTLDYLSGLLIGEEIRSVVAGLANTANPTTVHCPSIVLLGDPTLCNRYRLALSQFGIDDVQALNETGPLGLWRIGEAAGLVAHDPDTV